MWDWNCILFFSSNNRPILKIKQMYWARRTHMCNVRSDSIRWWRYKTIQFNVVFASHSLVYIFFASIFDIVIGVGCRKSDIHCLYSWMDSFVALYFIKKNQNYTCSTDNNSPVQFFSPISLFSVRPKCLDIRNVCGIHCVFNSDMEIWTLNI